MCSHTVNNEGEWGYMEAWAGALLQPGELPVKSRSKKEITLKKGLLFLFIWIQGTGLELSSKPGGISAEVVIEFVR